MNIHKKHLKTTGNNGLLLAALSTKALKTTGHNGQLSALWKKKRNSLEWFSVHKNHSVAI